MKLGCRAFKMKQARDIESQFLKLTKLLRMREFSSRAAIQTMLNLNEV